MRTAKSSNRSLEAAMALLIQNQATFVAHLQRHENEFAKINHELDEIKRSLLRHERILADLFDAIARLPDVIREKIGFKPQ
jgi:1-aminocyclopropane-1-carboxylate deaminase/D-cysteine desulfhydrase-like pyridoxal-dependent ACC family enzyme